MKKFVCTLSDISPDSYEDIVRRISVMFDNFRRTDENTLADGDVTIAFCYDDEHKTAEISSDIDLPDEIFSGYEADIRKDLPETADVPKDGGGMGAFGISVLFAAAVFGIIAVDTALRYGAAVLSAAVKTAVFMYIPPVLISAVLFAVLWKFSRESRFAGAAFRTAVLLSVILISLEMSGYSFISVYSPVLAAAYFCTLGRIRERIGGNTFRAEAVQLAATFAVSLLMWAAGRIVGGLGGALFVSVAVMAAQMSAAGMVLAAAAAVVARRTENDDTA